MNFSIRVGHPGDAGELARYAREQFIGTYSPTHPAGDIDRYCAEEFTDAAVASALLNKDVWAALAAAEDGVTVGYIWLDAGAPPEALRLPAPLHMRRLFVSPEWHGRAVAQALMMRCCDEAAARNASHLWLAVWQEAARPIRFYEKCGFRVAATSTFAMAGHVDQDFIMVRELRR
jgi:GNAT superfamily N-acetyltransferase